jgi:gamma-glutamylcyclotransferase (GGCT)/AIG2-like uncharacterized protein YtfP
MKEKDFILVYGSLCSHGFNHFLFDFNKHTKFISRQKIDGLRLYDLGSYPCAIITGFYNDAIITELYEYKDDEIINDIRDMEISAGYIEANVCLGLNNQTLRPTIFVYDHIPKNGKHIPSGFWVQKIL